ncbi:TetR/AcrR family transcriptional regulator [Glaesserella parasuis]|uniref:TetR/AcrR family transcriptional regulator n=1 Tax=Glaesserella parasuis TaxID=738 RepID=UPI002436C7D5|nr:TetR/AcrR family transcriptional regulator [Glaesserella parasuis]MDG6815552.1 TetR/AcrR family transcriptional regulator [Glaesserella parasuis]
MAKEGVQNLSTHKIAKEAGVSVGTIYLYFKDKRLCLISLCCICLIRFILR